MDKLLNFYSTYKKYILGLIGLLLFSLILLKLFGKRHHRNNGRHGDRNEIHHNDSERRKGSKTRNNDDSNNITSQAGNLVHTVYFKLKPGADKAAMVKSLESLKNIKVVNNVTIGDYVDTGNATTLKGYDLIMQMTLDNIEAFKKYEIDSIHLASKNGTKDLLAGPPIGYDYIVK